jgi:hypothetical protein
MSRLEMTPWQSLVIKEVCPSCRVPAGHWCRTNMFYSRPKANDPAYARDLHITREHVADHRMSARP